MRSTMLRDGLVALCVLTAVVLLPLWAAGQEAAPPAAPAAVQVARATTEKPATPATWREGMALARKGQFPGALQAFEDLAKTSPKDQVARQAAGLLKDYLAVMRGAEAERKTELVQAAQRVERTMLAEKSLPELAKAKIEAKLRKQVQEALTAFADAAGFETIASGEVKSLEEARQNTVKAYATTIVGIKKALPILKGRSDEYARTFGEQARRCLALLGEQQKVWQSVKLGTPAQRQSAEDKIQAKEDDVLGSLGDVEALISSKPWRIGLMHARLAKQIAVPADKLGEQPWYKTFVAAMEKRGAEAIKQAKWYDALAVYVSLEELNPDSPEYRRMSKTVRRHVRVLGLYGSREEAEAINGDDGEKKPPTTAPKEEEDEPTWKEVVSRVDVDMIEKVIEQLDGYYVRSVDYRQVTRGGLRSVKVLAETPQAAHTFGALADEKKRSEFVKAIDRQLETIEKRDRVDHLDLQLALNSILRASDRTVRIPTAVLAVEFTDGFLDELDKFSAMIWPNDVDIFKKQTMGHFFGVGIQITKEPGEPLKVVTPLAGSPAFNAGVKTNDLIIAVDGKRTEGKAIDKLVRLITGPKGTKVVLRIKRVGLVKPIDVPIERDEIHIRTVKGWRRAPGGEWDYMIDPQRKIAYVRITQFTDQTPRHTELVLARLQKAGVKSLIVDLRFNPGGLLRAASAIANEFLASGRIVSTRGLQVSQVEINAQPTGRWLTGDVVFLVNQHSASASEIVSGAISDRQRGLLVGQRTYGKGSVQNVIPISKHSAYLKLTTAYYYLPLGRCLHRIEGAKTWGVDPDVNVMLTPHQIKRWLDIRRRTDLIQDIDAKQLQADLDEQFQVDYQLNAAVLMLKLLQLDDQHQGKRAA